MLGTIGDEVVARLEVLVVLSVRGIVETGLGDEVDRVDLSKERSVRVVFAGGGGHGPTRKPSQPRSSHQRIIS